MEDLHYLNIPHLNYHTTCIEIGIVRKNIVIAWSGIHETLHSTYKNCHNTLDDTNIKWHAVY